ncbi:hypothetical protein O3M35_010226 [Rhynocoris fuscipes]|uniref:Origin recognition complex subunit 2 n=1 Tax=Rhynocoris fuscipes TaxID=488301 RepID=A0AAW1D1R4_9HEMI
MFQSTNADEKTNGNLSEDSDETVQCKDTLDSSYELFTPRKTRASVHSKSVASPVLCTRSGRKVKKTQYSDFQTEFQGTVHRSFTPSKVTNNMETPVKSGALKELNFLKDEFSELSISSGCKTPTRGRKSVRLSEAASKVMTPKGKIISPNHTYTKSGRKIKKIQYADNDISDYENDISKVSGTRNQLYSTSHITPVRTPTHTRSGRKIKKLEYLEDEFFISPKKNSKKNNKMEVDSPDKASKKNNSPDVINEENNVMDSSSEIFTPSSKTKLNNGKTSKLCVTPTEIVSPPLSCTRSGRKVKKKKYIDDTDEEMKDANQIQNEDSNIDEKQNEETDHVSKNIFKPSALYEDDNEVGDQIFCFQSYKSRNSMMEKAIKSASKTNNLLKTPKSSQKSKISANLKTPYNMRKRIKRGIVKEVSRQTVDALLEDSGSDYVPTSSSSEESDADEVEDSDDSDNSSIEISGVVPLDATVEPLRENLLKKKSKSVNNNFMFTPEDYFDHKNLRSITSNHTLSQLKTPRLNQFQLNDILKSISNRHEKFMNELHLENEAMFPRWLYSMNEGFNILVYGVGSKKNLLCAFHKQFLSRCYVAVVNGYFPGLLLKDIFDCMINDILKLRCQVPTQPHDIVKFIGAKLRSRNNRIFLLVHNIDGPSLRCEKTQSVLAHLAADPNIHMVATVDHINSPLLWDQKKLSQFNFIWEDGTSFLPYLNETSYENSLMVQQSGEIALSGLKNIFKSLNANSRKIFQILLEHQLQDNSNKSQGMLFSQLYRECRNSFLVSSDLALRTQLTEFFDHELVKWKKDQEHLIIPLDISTLKKFQSYLESQND